MTCEIQRGKRDTKIVFVCDLAVDGRFAVVRPEAHGMELHLSLVRQRIEGSPASPEGSHFGGQPRLQFGSRSVVGKIEDRSLGIEAVEFLGEDIQALQDQVPRFGKWKFRLVGVLVPMRHDLVAPLLQFVPEAEITFGNVFLVLVGRREVLPVPRGDDVDTGLVSPRPLVVGWPATHWPLAPVTAAAR